MAALLTDSSSSPEELPTARELLTSLINAISEIPLSRQPVHLPEQQQQHDDSPSNALKLVPSPHRHLIVTLHVLFPGLLLPALDLLDRGLVQRIVAAVVVDDEFSGISTSIKRPESGNAAGGGGGEPKTRGTTTNLKNRSGSSNSSFYLVRSAAQLSSSSSGHGRHRSRSGDGHGPGKTDAGGRRMYMVRLGAWNCTCAAFAFAAFPPEPGQEQQQQQPPPGQQESPTKEGAVGEDRRVIRQEGVETETETETGEKREKGASEEEEEEEWSFGGCTLDININGTAPPVCKHLLACLLADRWSAALGRYVVERRVGRVEMAGMVADV